MKDAVSVQNSKRKGNQPETSQPTFKVKSPKDDLGLRVRSFRRGSLGATATIELLYGPESDNPTVVDRDCCRLFSIDDRRRFSRFISRDWEIREDVLEIVLQEIEDHLLNETESKPERPTA